MEDNELNLSEALQGAELDELLSSFELGDSEGSSPPLPYLSPSSGQEQTESVTTEGEDAGATTLEKKREDNRRRCRKFRQRRREKEQQVYVENLQLKRERVDFLDQISELEYTIQALKGQGVLDLRKENELLKLEIKKHKAYIERVIDTVVHTPLDTKRVEITRTLTSAAENAVSQLVGLMYSSMNEKMWSKANTVELNSGDDSPPAYIYPRWQNLPIGSSAKEARRLNSRMDLPVNGVPADQIADFAWSVSSRIDVLQAKFESIPHLKEYKLREVFEKTEVADKSQIQCLALTKSMGDKTAEVILVSSLKEIEIHPVAYDENVPGSAPMEKVKVIASTSCNVNIPVESSQAEDVERVQDLAVEGVVFRNTGEDSAVVTTIASTAVNSWLHSMYCNDQPMVDENGDMNSCVVDMLKLQVMMYNACATVPCGSNDESTGQSQNSDEGSAIFQRIMSSKQL